MYTKRVLYLSMGSGIYSDMHTYGGGLEILSGDNLKGVMDSNGKYPMTFMHILWKKGYVLQKVDEFGNVYNVDAEGNNWENYLEDTGKNVTVEVFGNTILLKIWKLKSGPAYFLDADLPENGDFRNITWYLYGGAWNEIEKERIAQEIVLGIGGVRAIKALGIQVDAYHYNDGHPAFAGIEIISRKMSSLRSEGYVGDVWKAAFEYVKSRTYFTTHTNVPAGNESHPISMLREVGATLDLTDEQLEYLGGNPFNMTVASLNMSRRANGVSRLQVLAAHEMWKDVKFAPPIIAITNGIHPGTWQNKAIAEAYNHVNLDRLYKVHLELKEDLIGYINEKYNVNFSSKHLTLGFARRATEYKRWLLLFRNQKKCEELFYGTKVQIIFAGKAHRYDGQGREFIKEVAKLAKIHPNNVIFLEGYDIELAQMLVSGVDVWVNNPRVPLEACGTSGMKAAMNGVLNLSTLDGWWREGCIDKVAGWSIPTPVGVETEAEIDDIDAENLLDTLNYDVKLAYSQPNVWKNMMFASIVMSEQYKIERMLEEYYVNLYGKL